MEAVSAEEDDGAAKVSDAEMDSFPEWQLLSHSRCPPGLVCVWVGVFFKMSHTADEKQGSALVVLYVESQP